MRWRLGLGLILCLFMAACFHISHKSSTFVTVKSWPKIPRPANEKLFEQALENSLNFYNRLPSDYVFFVDDTSISVQNLKQGLIQLKECLLATDWQGCLHRHFRPLKVRQPVLFTGYYQPVLYGSLKPTKRFRYPIYKLPRSWVAIHLKQFGDDLPAKTLIGMVSGHEVVPFYDRKAIDFEHRLKGNELVWVDDPIELFFLHIQGSGIVILPDGQKRFVHYAATNGRPYRSIGRLMKEWGWLNHPNGLNIKAYLRAHPELMPKVFSANPSYVFFKFVDRGPLGALSEVLIPYYSVATDPSIFPRGGLLFVTTQIPQVDQNQRFLGWQPFNSLVFSQDVGGAIKGAQRIDIFFGTGSIAEAQACYMEQKGTVYVLVPKRAQ